MSEIEKKEVEEVVEQAEEVVEENVMEQIVHDPNAPIISIKKLLEAGVHYGHQTKKWNPKMAKYIFAPNHGIYIIDLQKSKLAIENAYVALKGIVENGGKVLFVGTKQQAKQIVEAESLRSGSFYVTNRWLGGVLTNFRTIQSRIKKLKEMEEQEVDGTWDKLPKKEVIQLKKLQEKLKKNLEGIKEMRKAPDAVVVVDPIQEHNAIKEALKLKIPVFAICDTNADPDNINYVIPGNDDATKSIQLIVSTLADAVVEAKGGITNVAHTKDEGDEATMDDAIREAERQNALRVAARKEMLREKLEKEKARRAQFEAKRNHKPFDKTNKVEEVKVEEKVEEVAAEDKTVETAEVKKTTRKPRAKKVTEEKVEEVKESE